MKYADPLLLSDSVRSYEPKRRRTRDHAKYLAPYFVIAVDETTRHVEIYPPGELFSSYFETADKTIVGLALTKKESEQMVASLVTETFKDSGTSDVYGYLQKTGVLS